MYKGVQFTIKYFFSKYQFILTCNDPIYVNLKKKIGVLKGQKFYNRNSFWNVLPISCIVNVIYRLFFLITVKVSYRASHYVSISTFGPTSFFVPFYRFIDTVRPSPKELKP